MPPRLGDHDAGLRPKPRDVAVPEPLLGLRSCCSRCQARSFCHHRTAPCPRECQQYQPDQSDEPRKPAFRGSRRVLPERRAFAQMRLDIGKA